MADEEKDEKAGFRIEGREYAFPSTFRLGDPVLVKLLTGMEFKDFAAALDDEDQREDPTILVGLIGVAVWQGNPRWTREKVIAYVQRIDLEGFEAFGGEAADPPKPAATPEQEPEQEPEPEPTTAADSDGDSDDSQDESNRLPDAA